MIKTIENIEQQEVIYSKTFTKKLFNNLSESYFLCDYFSFGLANTIRKKNISLALENLTDKNNLVIADFMSGSCENSRLINQANIQHIINVDFSDKMIEKAKKKQNDTIYLNENVLENSIENSSLDCVISSFGLKTLTKESTELLAEQTERVLRKKGSFCYCEFNLQGLTKVIVLSSLFILISLSIVLFPFRKSVYQYNFLTYSSRFNGDDAFKIFKQKLPGTKKVKFLGLAIFIYGIK